MFAKDEMKHKYEHQFDRKKNYQNIISQTEKKKIAPKIMIVMACAVFVFTLSMPLWNQKKDTQSASDSALQEIGSQIVLKINKSNDLYLDETPALKADMKMEIAESDEEYEFLESICPKGFKASELRQCSIINGKALEQTKMIMYYRITFTQDERNIVLAFSESNWPFRCSLLSSEHETSILDGVKMDISNESEKYLALFEMNGMYFDVETKGITENELIDFLLNLVEKASETE